MARYRFATGHVFDSESGEVRGPQGTARLEPQPAALLVLLVEHAGTLVTHTDISRRIWGEATHVNFRQSIHYGIRQIRGTLGDTRPRGLIENVPRRGYRLRPEALAAVEVPAPDRQGAAEPEPRWSGPLLKRRPIVVAGLAALIVITMLVERRPNHHHEIAVRMLRAMHGLVYVELREDWRRSTRSIPITIQRVNAGRSAG